MRAITIPQGVRTTLNHVGLASRDYHHRNHDDDDDNNNNNNHDDDADADADDDDDDEREANKKRPHRCDALPRLRSLSLCVLGSCAPCPARPLQVVLHASVETAEQDDRLQVSTCIMRPR